MTPSTYDKRPLEEISNDLMLCDADQIDTTAELIVICDRLMRLETRLERMRAAFKCEHRHLNPLWDV